jgi:hypothetical protein
LRARFHERLDRNVGTTELFVTARRNLAGYGTFESEQALGRLFLHRRPEYDGQLIDLPVKTIGIEERRAELGQPSQVQFLERLDVEQTFEKSARLAPRMMNAQLLSRGLRPAEELSEGVILIPGDE